MRRREVLLVVLLLATVHILLWSRSIPLPYQDLSFYFEPAILLASQGWLAGPGSHWQDLTYVRGMYFYPPGFSLILGGWIELFGTSARSLLAYTHVVHTAYLTVLWLTLRARLRCSPPVSALVLFSAFPMFGHGRPDLTALLLGALAWLTLPTGPDPDNSKFKTHNSQFRLLVSGALLGAAVLTSPPFGISSAVAIGLYFLVAADDPPRVRWARFGLLTGAALLVFAGSWALVLTWQDAWRFGLEQFAVNSSIRAAELNTFPQPSLYLVAFSLIPLGLLTLLPLLVTLLTPEGRADRRLVRTAVAYVGGFIAWFVLSKAPLLTGAHHSYLARPLLHGALASARGWLGRLGMVALLGFSVVHWYHQKDNLLGLSQGYAAVQAEAAAIQLPADAIVALDSDAFPHLYQEGRSVTFELMGFDYWERSLEETSPQTMAELGLETCRGPVIPDLVVASARSLMIFGPPDPGLFVPVEGRPPDIEPARLLGRPVRFPREPGRLYLYRRRPEIERQSGGETSDCHLLPAVPPP